MSYHNLRGRKVSKSSPETAISSESTMQNENKDKEITLKDIMNLLEENQKELQTIKASQNSMMVQMESVTKDITEIKTELNDLKTTVTVVETDVANVKRRVEISEGAIHENSIAVTNLMSKEESQAKAIRQLQVDQVYMQWRSMRHNVIVHNVPDGGANETDEDCMELVRKVLRDNFKVNPTSINIAVAHRLKKQNVNNRRGIIFKLAVLKQKDILWNNIKNNTIYNNLHPNDKIFIDMTQLPEKLAKDKQSLQEKFFAAKNDHLNPKWRYDRNKGEYCYVIGHTYYRPRVNFFEG